MTEAQIQLQNALTTTFLANLAFLSEYDNELYHRIENLSRMIEQGTYKERYELEFVMENGDFDILDTQTNQYIYGKNPRKINSDLLEKIDFENTKSFSSIEGFFEYKNSPTIDINFEFKGEFGSLLQSYLHEYSITLNDFLDNKTKKYKKIEKFIFFGTFLGRHIPAVAQKIDASLYMVFESNLEIFRLSLFTVDYTILAKNSGVIFSIMDDTLDVEKKISLFLNIGRFDNYLIKFIDINTNVDKYYYTLISLLNTMKATKYDFLRRLYVYVNKTTNCIKEGYDFLLFDRLKEELKILKDTPVLYLAAGPSLDENIDWIYNNQDKFFIVTIGSVYNKLLNKGIRVDLVTTLDEQKWLERVQFSNEILEKSSKHTIFFASAITNEKILKKLNKKNLFIFEIYESFFKNNYSFDGHSIGEVTLDILLQLNIKNIYLIGLDLALNQKTGDTHSNSAGSGVSKVDINNKEKSFSRKSLVTVKGNFEKKVKTIELFYSSIKDIEQKLILKNESTTIYNLSKHGAYFEGTIPLNLEEVDIKSFKTIDIKYFDLQNNLKKFSKDSLDESRKKSFIDEINFLQQNLKEQLNAIKEYDFKNYIDLNSIILDFLQNLKDNDILILYKVLHNYYEMVIPYLNYHFNDSRLNQEYKKVEKIKDIFTTQVENLINDYIFCINKII
ncbi:hypothetical protein CRU92_03090 [Arcobacter sp. FW59]|nr:hypothetical protein CRU92_03090 [Arcobacter sp. FW59]